MDRVSRLVQHLTPQVSAASVVAPGAPSSFSTDSAHTFAVPVVSHPTSASDSSSSSSTSSSSAVTASSSSSSSSSSSLTPSLSSDVSLSLGHMHDLRWNGWGYRDTEFILDSSGHVALTGSRYLFSGRQLPSLRPWMEEKVGMNVDEKTPSQTHPKASPAIVNAAFLQELKSLRPYKELDETDEGRLFHAHGHTCQEVYMLRFERFPRIPDIVVFPSSHSDVVQIVELAQRHNVVLIPFGGGTSVSQALMCPPEESRMIVSLDLHHMNRIKWINKKNMLACIEAGAVGRDIERALAPHGVVLGHEPDSVEFSTLGGWVATRASGMRKNKYGNIEDIVVHIRLVTPTGVVEKNVAVPRLSTGPDVHHLILGSEGTLGVVTEVIVRLRPQPECTAYGSIVFPNFDVGVKFMYEVAMNRLQPASIRLVDNMQFQFSMALKPPVESWKEDVMGKIKKWYLLNALHFDANAMCACTLLFEGTKEEVRTQQRAIYSLAKRYGGVAGGEENGIRGYFLTYMIAYLRDFGFNFSFIGESFETTVPWENVYTVCQSVKARIEATAKRMGVKKTPFMSCRVTQLYDTAACIYFYFGFVWSGLKEKATDVFSVIEHDARDEIMRFGGSLSHHHGIGKLRKYALERSNGKTAVELVKVVKQTLDPKNIFGNGNLV